MLLSCQEIIPSRKHELMNRIKEFKDAEGKAESTTKVLTQATTDVREIQDMVVKDLQQHDDSVKQADDQVEAIQKQRETKTTEQINSLQAKIAALKARLGK